MSGNESKLVRDNIPEIVEEATGTRPTVSRIESSHEFRQALFRKLDEETAEMAEASSTHLAEELADIIEVLHAIALLDGITVDAIEATRLEKRSRVGGFDLRLMMNPKNLQA